MPWFLSAGGPQLALILMHPAPISETSNVPSLRVSIMPFPVRSPLSVRHPSDLVDHNCARFRFSGSGAIYKWQLQVDGRMVEYEVSGNLTISDSLFPVEAALEGIALAYTFEQLALPHIQAKKLKRVLSAFSPTFQGFYLYYPSSGSNL